MPVDINLILFTSLRRGIASLESDRDDICRVVDWTIFSTGGILFIVRYSRTVFLFH